MTLILAIVGGVVVAVVILGYVLNLVDAAERLTKLWRRHVLRRSNSSPGTSIAPTVTGSGPTIVVQPGATLTINYYADGLPGAALGVRRHFREGQRLQKAHEHDKAIAEFEAALATADTDSRRGALYLHIGNSNYLSGRLPQAEGNYTEGLRLFQGAHDHQGQAAALGNLGLIYADRGALDRAEEHYKHALEIDRRIDNPLGQAQTLGNLGLVYYSRGDLDSAEEHHKASLEMNRRVNNPSGEAAALGNLGLIYADRGALDRAEEHYKHALEIFRRIGDSLGQAHDLSNLGFLAKRRGQPEEAQRLLTEALALYERIGAGGEGPDAARDALRRLEAAGGEEKPPRRARKRKDQQPPAG